MKKYKKYDVQTPGRLPRIYASKEDLSYCPLEWHLKGLQQTASGYGSQITSPYKIHFEGKLRRLYSTCCSSVASLWFKCDGQKIYIN